MWAAGVPPQDVLNCFDTIVVQGASFETELRGYSYRGDVRVLPYLPPLCGDPTPFPSPSVTRVGYLGRLAAQKNLAYLVQAFCVARRNGLDAELHIFGAGPERGALQARAEQMGVSHLVCFHGSKAHREVPAAIDSCHMFAFTSISEGQCLAALEILARGRPVVATPVGAFPEFLSDGLLGTLAAPDQPEEFARSLVTVARQIRENTFTPNGVQAAYRKRFPREQVIQGYVDLISECERPE
ncbi:MAG: glycosyltransferase [Bryobacteraceae bacterium]